MSSNIIALADEVSKSADIVEVISHFIKLEKRGKNYVALCPFHDDHSLGNFSVNREKGLFKCFACNSGGNGITFVQKFTNCSFSEAVKKTAEIIGFKDDRLKSICSNKPIDKKTEVLFNCLNDIANFYEASLYQTIDGKEALEYLYKRGLNDEIIHQFRIGYAQSNGENIISFLLKKKYSLETISQTGILDLNKTPYSDINRGRIVFNILNKEGKIVGFSCRKFRLNDNSNAKYINTSSTKLFNKSDTLYNFYDASLEAKKVGYVYLCEGFMDVIACCRVGVKSAVALMGTALSKENLQSLLYLKCEVRICLDLDNPGQINTYKTMQALEQYGIHYRVVNNDVDFLEKDSDEILKKYGDEKLRIFLTDLVTKIEWLFNFYKRTYDLSKDDGKKKFLNNIIPFIANINDPVDYEIYKNKISQVTGFDASLIEKLIVRCQKKAKKEEHKNEPKQIIKIDFNKEEFKRINAHLSRLNLAERRLVGYMLENNEAFRIYQEKLGYIVDSSYKHIVAAIEEYMIQVGSTIDYNVNNLLNFISDDTFIIDNKDEIKSEISNISLENQLLPPYKEENVEELIDTIKLEKEKKQINTIATASIKGESAVQKASRLAVSVSKLKHLVKENDKKRR